MPKYWIGVASREHVMRGVEGGFAMLNHGRKGPLERMKAGDILIYYSPKEKLDEKAPLQKFVAVGRVLEGSAYQVKMSEDFQPFRKNVEYLKSDDAEIKPLIDELSFIKDKKSWGYAFRFGHIEIAESDLKLIAKAMKANV
ncbi:MAG: EVE domain-containing protein [Acidobacteriota bacterium]